MSDAPSSGAPRAIHGFKGERVLMRIHIGESDRWDGTPLYVAIVELLRKRRFAGATVFRGVMGFGAHATLHQATLFRLSSDLPIVIECVETEANIEAVLPELDRMIGGGLVTLERARVILYRPDAPPHDGSETGWSVDVTGDWRVPQARPEGGA
jgi:PII-like signaling protein